MHTARDRWLLPVGIQEILPPEALRIECARRRVLDLFQSWGYELIMPPFIEYLESLLTGTGPDLDLQTFKLIDQLSGRMMGVRADMTPQAAKLDAHHLQRSGPVRLCYLGTVLHTLPKGMAGSRSPMQLGAELYGHAGVEADCEIICLMLETLANAGIEEVHLDIGHMGIFRGLAAQAGVSEEQEAGLFSALQRKASAEVEILLEEAQVTPKVADMLLSLVGLNGGEDVIARAERILTEAAGEVADAIARLRELTALLSQRIGNVLVHFDLAELRGYRYERGVVFAAYIAGHGEEIARGGRYDGIGNAFGRARPAIGFSTDLKTLVALRPAPPPASESAILAPWSDDAALQNVIRELREDGEIVINELPGHESAAHSLGCDRVLASDGSHWVVKEV